MKLIIKRAPQAHSGNAVEISVLILSTIFGICWFQVGCNKTEPVSEEKERTNQTASGVTRAADVRHGVPVATIIGSAIKFGRGGTSEHYILSGWSPPEERFTFTEGKVAKLLLPIHASPGPLIFRLKAKAMTNPPEVPFQPVEVYANGRKVADWKVSTLDDYSAEIPADLTTHGGRLLVELQTPKAIPPQASERETRLKIRSLFIVTSWN